MVSRRVLITGAASGIGSATVRIFAENGWDVCGLDRIARPPDLPAAEWLGCDLDDEPALSAGIARLAASPWNALVNCAGIAGIGDAGRVLRINFFSHRRLTEALAPRIEPGSAIIHVSSGAGIKWREQLTPLRAILAAPDAAAMGLCAPLAPDAAAAYILSKQLLSCYGLATCLEQMRRGVRSNVVSPGGVETPLIPDFTRAMGSDAMDFSHAVTGRHGSPAEIAAAIHFLASPAASWINGAELFVDGGLTAALTTGTAVFPAWD